MGLTIQDKFGQHITSYNTIQELLTVDLFAFDAPTFDWNDLNRLLNTGSGELVLLSSGHRCAVSRTDVSGVLAALEAHTILAIEQVDRQDAELMRWADAWESQYQCRVNIDALVFPQDGCVSLYPVDAIQVCAGSGLWGNQQLAAGQRLLCDERAVQIVALQASLLLCFRLDGALDEGLPRRQLFQFPELYLTQATWSRDSRFERQKWPYRWEQSHKISRLYACHLSLDFHPLADPILAYMLRQDHFTGEALLAAFPGCPWPVFQAILLPLVQEGWLKVSPAHTPC